MAEYTYTIGETPFEEWAQTHKDCELLHMKGKIVDNLEGEVENSYNTVIQSMPVLKCVDVGQLKIIPNEGASQSLEYWRIAIDEDYYWEKAGYYLGLLGKMVINKDYGSYFTINKDTIISKNGKTIVWMRPQEKLEIPNGVERIGRYAFAEYDETTAVSIPDTVKEIKNGAFVYAEIKSLFLPDSVNSIGPYAFHECPIKELHISNSLTIIPKYCFSNILVEKIIIPPSTVVIQEYAFGSCKGMSIHIPEGVRQIKAHAFPEVRRIELPSTLKYLDAEFAEGNDSTDMSEPSVYVSPKNKWYYDIDGELYRIEENEPPNDPESILPVGYRIVKLPVPIDKEYSVEEIKADYLANNIAPINSEQTRFWVYMSDTGYNIINRSKQPYIISYMVSDIRFTIDGPVLIIDRSYRHHLFSNDLSKLLFSDEEEEYCIYDFDNEGRVYVEQDETMNWENFSPFAPSPKKCWCIYYDETPVLTRKYEGLGVFSKDGIATAKLDKRWGMINLQEEVIIPFEYRELSAFDEYGMAEAKKGQKRGYINRKNEVVISFKYDLFYRKFNDEGVAIAMIGRDSKPLSYYVDRNNNVLGTQIKDAYYDSVWYKKFHIFEKDGLYGYCRQFGEEFSGCIYKEIEMVKPDHIRVSLDGIHFEDIPYDADTKI